MPYLKNGNARDYLLEHLNGNRLQIVHTPHITVRILACLTPHVQLHGISLGLVYLHSHHIVHGDLKAALYLLQAMLPPWQLNILIDDNTKAVLCNFGLSHVKADATSRTMTVNGAGIMGSCNWMAPEQLMGGSLKKPCDIY